VFDGDGLEVDCQSAGVTVVCGEGDACCYWVVYFDEGLGED